MGCCGAKQRPSTDGLTRPEPPPGKLHHAGLTPANCPEQVSREEPLHRHAHDSPHKLSVATAPTSADNATAPPLTALAAHTSLNHTHNTTTTALPPPIVAPTFDSTVPAAPSPSPALGDSYNGGALNRTYGNSTYMGYEDNRFNATGRTAVTVLSLDATHASDDTYALLQEGRLTSPPYQVIPTSPSITHEGFYDRAFDSYPVVQDAEGVAAKYHTPTSAAPAVSWKQGHLLGKGQYGAVYECIDTAGNLAAVKIIDLAQTPVHKSAIFCAELHSLRRLQHPNIVQCYGCILTDSKLHFFMEHCQGGSLADRLATTERLSAAHIRSYTRQILKGLEYLHGNGVVHRDIKGANVLLGSKGLVKLADFGCSKELEDTLAAATGQYHIGSPGWLAPEVVRHPDAAPHPKSDVWSVGCTVIEMLGRHPWGCPHSNPFSLIFHIGTSKGPPSGIPEGLPLILEDMLLRCFERRVSDRPGAGELAMDPFFTTNQPCALPPYAPQVISPKLARNDSEGDHDTSEVDLEYYFGELISKNSYNSVPTSSGSLRSGATTPLGPRRHSVVA